MSLKLSGIQKLVIEQLAARRERDLLVSAGAGSGKTTILVESVLAALREGVPLDKILVVTFTDKAATEMKNKIYRALGESDDLAHHRLRLPQAWISTIHSFCQRLLRDSFDRAGVDPRFRVLSAEDASLLLEDATTRVFHERYERGGRGATEEVFEELVEMCGYDATGERLRAVVHTLLERARTSEAPERFLDGHAARLAAKPKKWDDLVWRRDYAARIAREWRTAAGLLRAVMAELPANKKWTAFREVVESIDPDSLGTPEGQSAAVERLEAAGFVKGIAPLKITTPSLPSGTGDLVGDLKETMAKAFQSEWIAEMPVDPARVLADEGLSSRLAFGLIDLARDVGRAYGDAKARTGRLDFEDLQIRALGLVEEFAAAGRPIRYERVFIDEFQDVNGLQHRLLEQLCDPTRIFRVGDVKQSIYQFRLADPTIIRDLGRGRPLIREAEEAPDGTAAWNVLLPKNYRSLPNVIRAANEIAGGLFFEEEIGTRYEAQALVAGREATPEDPEVELLLVRKDGAAVEEEPDAREPGTGAKDITTRIAAAGDAAAGDAATGDAAAGAAAESVDMHDAEWGSIAARIHELVADGTVRDPDSGKPRKIGYSDIAILLRAYSRAPELARRLEEEGIPCSVTTGESFFEAPEVRDATNLLRAVDNMLDDITLAASLRSPAFQWSDAELLAARLAYPRAMHVAFILAALADRGTGDGRYARILLPEDARSRAILLGDPAELPDEVPFTTLPQRAREALDCFLRWRDAAGWSELPDLVGKILSETGLPRSVASLPGGLRRRANLRKFQGISRRYAQEAGPSLTRFIRWLDLLKESNAKIFEAPVSSESVPSVRILSIHKAKGLEFPVVIVAEMGRRYQLGARTTALVPGRGYLGVRLLDPKTYLLRQPIPLRLLTDAAKDDDLAEEKRVLYVALTRARDRLILSGVVDARSSVPEPFYRAYQGALRQRDELERATIRTLLAKKPQPISWAIYTLPALPPDGGGIEGLPIRVKWIAPSARATVPPGSNPIRDIEGSLRRGETIEIPGGPDAAAENAVTLAARAHPRPLPGLLASARGKLWATEFKSERDVETLIEEAAATEGSPDEPAEPLVPREATAAGATAGAGTGAAPDAATGAGATAGAAPGAPAAAAAGARSAAGSNAHPISPDAAASEGTQIHALLERIDLAGIATADLDARIADAAAPIGGIPDETARMLRGSLAHMLTLPIGHALASGGEVHREVAFSLRLSLPEVARWLPDLREEILASPDWNGWTEEDGEGGLRFVRDTGAGDDDPWVLVQGRIDLVLATEDGWAVLDWKSDRVSPGETLEKRLELYKGQMEIYRRAVGALFGAPVSAWIYFLRPGILREV